MKGEIFYSKQHPHIRKEIAQGIQGQNIRILVSKEIL